MYGTTLGQVINFNKSSVSFSANVSEVDVQQVYDIFKVTAATNYGDYLGLPSSIYRRKKYVLKFIKDKVWNQKILSQAGKEILWKTLA